MCNGAPQWKSLLDHTIQLINKELAAGKTTQPTGFYTYAYTFQQLWQLKHVYCPAKIRLAPHNANNNSEKESVNQMELLNYVFGMVPEQVRKQEKLTR